MTSHEFIAMWTVNGTCEMQRFQLQNPTRESVHDQICTNFGFRTDIVLNMKQEGAISGDSLNLTSCGLNLVVFEVTEEQPETSLKKESTVQIGVIGFDLDSEAGQLIRRYVKMASRNWILVGATDSAQADGFFVLTSTDVHQFPQKVPAYAFNDASALEKRRTEVLKFIKSLGSSSSFSSHSISEKTRKVIVFGKEKDRDKVTGYIKNYHGSIEVLEGVDLVTDWNTVDGLILALPEQSSPPEWWNKIQFHHKLVTKRMIVGDEALNDFLKSLGKTKSVENTNNDTIEIGQFVVHGDQVFEVRAVCDDKCESLLLRPPRNLVSECDKYSLVPRSRCNPLQSKYNVDDLGRVLSEKYVGRWVWFGDTFAAVESVCIDEKGMIKHKLCDRFRSFDKAFELLASQLRPVPVSCRLCPGTNSKPIPAWSGSGMHICTGCMSGSGNRITNTSLLNYMIDSLFFRFAKHLHPDTLECFMNADDLRQYFKTIAVDIFQKIPEVVPRSEFHDLFFKFLNGRNNDGLLYAITEFCKTTVMEEIVLYDTVLTVDGFMGTVLEMNKVDNTIKIGSQLGKERTTEKWVKVQDVVVMH